MIILTMVKTVKIQLFLTELRKSLEEIMVDMLMDIMDGHIMDMDMDMEKDPPILPELSMLPRERLRLIQMLIPGYYMDPTTIIHINHFQTIHHLKEKDQPEDTSPLLL